MEAIIERAAGLDVHQATVVAAGLIGKAAGRARKEVRTSGTMTQDLEALRDWPPLCSNLHYQYICGGEHAVYYPDL